LFRLFGDAWSQKQGHLAPVLGSILVNSIVSVSGDSDSGGQDNENQKKQNKNVVKFELGSHDGKLGFRDAESN